MVPVPILKYIISLSKLIININSENTVCHLNKIAWNSNLCFWDLYLSEMSVFDRFLLDP